MLQKDKRELLVVLASSFLMQLILSLLYHGPVDFFIHFDAARQISEGKILYYTVTAANTIGTFPYPDYPPVYLYLMGFLFYLFGPSKILMKLVLCIFNIFCAVILYYICLDMKLSTRQALSAVILFLFHPSSLTMVISGFFDNFPVFFILVSFYFIHIREYQSEKKRQFSAVISGITVGLGIMVKLFPAIMIFVIIPAFFRSESIKSAILFLLSTILTVLAISLPFLLFIPGEYVSHLFYHFESDWPNMSVYSSIFPQLYVSIIPLLLQGIFFILVALTVFLMSKETLNSVRYIQLYFILLCGFIFLNRVIYPHYIAWFIPFLVILMIINEEKDRTRLYYQIISQILVSLGGLLWSISWITDLFAEPISFLYSSGFLLFNFGLLMLIGAEIYWITKETDIWRQIQSRLYSN